MTKTGIATAVLVLCAGTATAQDAGGLTATFDLSQGLTYSDVDGTFGQTDLGFDFSSVTRSQSLEFGLGTSITQGKRGESDLAVLNPRANLAYAIQSRQTEVSTRLTYQQTDADDVFDDPNGALGELIFDDGTRETFDADLSVDFGREANFGGQFTLGYDETNYAGTASPDLIDTVGNSAGLSLRFDIDRTLTATLAYDWSDIERASSRDTVSENLRGGLNVEITPTLSANLSAGLRRITVTDAGVQTITDGATYSIDVTQTRPQGSLDYALTSDLTESGRRTTATVATSFETRRGTLSTSFGLSDGSDSKLRPIVTLSYNEDMPRGSYSIALDQDFSTDADGDETLNSRLQLAWRQDLTATSRMSSDLTYRVSDRLNLDDDTTRLELGLQYSQDLTQDWAVTTRYTHSVVNEDGAAASRENELFIGLETSFEWRS